MNRKKYFVAAIVLNTALLAFAPSVFHHLKCRAESGAGVGATATDPRKTALTGPSGKFGPVIETVLPPATETSVDILDLETGRSLEEPPNDHLSWRAEAIMAWIRSHGLDISCMSWQNGAACVTYDMPILPVEAKCWDQITEEELLANPALGLGRHAPRRQLVLGHDRPDTYIFRTAEGTFGILRIVGLSQNEPGVKIRYKLINSAKPVLTAKLS